MEKLSLKGRFTLEDLFTYLQSSDYILFEDDVYLTIRKYEMQEFDENIWVIITTNDGEEITFLGRNGNWVQT